MRTNDFNYELPVNLIAHVPAKDRPESRMLVLDRQSRTFSDRKFSDLQLFLRPSDCLVLNDTRVLPARFFLKKSTGAKLEGLFLDQPQPGLWKVLLKNARKIRPGHDLIILNRNHKEQIRAKALEKLDEGQWALKINSSEDAESILEKVGLAPLPPYIKRDAKDDRSPEDLRRYQTVYARHGGAVAAPTAGLHFDKAMLGKIQEMGVSLAYLTLHVGIGTFRPVSTENLEDHTMHTERYELPQQTADTINQTIEEGGRIIAVGTTSVRTLESVAQGRQVTAQKGQTRLFIKPGYEFQIVDAMITNFHLPRSTLLALVGAFAELDRIMDAYKHAINQQYRFYSYGDAMLIL